MRVDPTYVNNLVNALDQAQNSTQQGVSPPDPPPNVPAIKDRPVDSTGNSKPPTMRQTMELHHTNPVCASCHSLFEPMGLALENFDATGTWRTQDGDSPIDATGVLVDGTKVDGVATLRAWLMAHSDQFARVVTEKLMIYALGRGVDSQDMPQVRSIVRNAATRDYRFTSIVMGIVKSPEFQMDMKTDSGPEPSSAFAKTQQRASR